MTAAGQSGGPRMVTSAERLRRLLALVPYVVTRQAVGLAETAATFGMTERELIDDLNLAWCVELKSPEPYCPIDLSYEDGEVTISQAESIARPLRLAADEASALLVALRMLAEAGGDGDAVTRLVAKIEDAAGASAAPSSQVTIQIDRPNGPGVPAAVDAALAAGKRVHLRYYVPGRDEATERDVDPIKLAGGWRGAPTCGAGAGWPRGCGTSGSTGYWTSRCSTCRPRRTRKRSRPTRSGGCSGRRRRTCWSSSSWRAVARWVSEYYPYESLTELGEGRLRVAIRTPNTDLFRRLALRLGEDCRVIAPAELAEEVRSAAAAALALYD